MNKLKIERIKRNIKQKQLAKTLGITQQHLYRIEKGDVDLKKSLMLKIAKALDTTVQELFFSDEE